MVMNIRVLTPDRVICSTTADEIVLPGLTGQVGVLGSRRINYSFRYRTITYQVE
jgi:F0F1-type ATP synthase epsilon subunit